MWKCRHCGKTLIVFSVEYVQEMVSVIDPNSKEAKIAERKYKHGDITERNVSDAVMCYNCFKTANSKDDLCEWVEEE